jgi:predicted transcriptional regulator
MTGVAKASAKNETPVSPRKGGRPKAFDEETVKVALFLPPDLVGTLKALAARRRLTPSLVVAEWIEKAEVREAIARGRQAFEKGEVVSHAEALRRLAKW